MKRLTAILLGVFAFVLILSSTADACPLDRLRERRATVERKVERKVLIHRKHATDWRLPTGCAGGVCPVR